MPSKTKSNKKKYQIFMVGAYETKAVLDGTLWAYSDKQAVYLWAKKTGAISSCCVYDSLIAEEVK